MRLLKSRVDDDKAACRGIYLLIAVLWTLPLEAQVLPGRWEKLDVTTPGTELVVLLRTRMTIQGLFQGSTPDAVVVTQPGNIPVRIAKADVTRIMTGETYGDSLKNGGLIGGAVGLAARGRSLEGRAHGSSGCRREVRSGTMSFHRDRRTTKPAARTPPAPKGLRRNGAVFVVADSSQ